MDNMLRTVCAQCQSIFYENPKIIVGCIATYKNKVLLCRRAIEPRKGYWNLPAGFMENHETVQLGAAREVLEEAGVQAEIQHLHTVYSVLPVNQVYMIFKAELTSNAVGETIETLESRLFDIHEIPFQDLAFHANVFALQAYVQNPFSKEVHIGAFELKEI